MKILLICGLALAAGPARAATDAPLGESEAARLTESIEHFYAGPAGADSSLFDELNFSGLPVASIALSRVVRHMKDPGQPARRHALRMLEWTHSLLITCPPAGPMRFLDQQIKRNLTTLLDHFRDDPRVADQIALLIDLTSGWSSEHLPALARHAGRAETDEAAWYAAFAAQIETWVPADDKRLVELIRARRLSQRTAEQWGLLGLSGLVRTSEYAQILVLAAHAFANRGVEARVFASGHPVRLVLENLMADYKADQTYVEEALTEAVELAKKESVRVSPRPARLKFLKAFGNMVLLDPLDPTVTFEPEGPVAAPPPPVVAENNVVYPKFGCGRALER